MSPWEPGPQDHHELNELECRLSSWQPAPARLDRDQLLFDAGASAARAGTRDRFWKASTLSLALVVVSLGGMLAREQGRRLDLERTIAALDRVPSVPSSTLDQDAITPTPSSIDPSPPVVVARPQPEPLAPHSYLALTRRMLEGNLDEPILDRNSPRGTTVEQPRPSTRPLRVRDFDELMNL